MLEPSLNLTSISEQVFFFLYTSSLKVDPSRCFQMSGGNYENVAFDIILGVNLYQTLQNDTEGDHRNLTSGACSEQLRNALPCLDYTVT